MNLIQINQSKSFKEQFKQQLYLLFANGRVWFHVLVWCLIILLLVEKISNAATAERTQTLVIYYASFTFLIAYQFLLLIIPLARAKRNQWILWIGFALAILSTCFVSFASDFIKVITSKNISTFGDSNTYTFGVALGAIMISLTTFFSAYYFFDLYIQQGLLNNYKKKLEQKIEAENRFLKSQINPHFLFNTLNNIYGQSLKQPKLATQTLEQLKQLMQYMLYDCEQDFVLLSKEVEFIKSFTELEAIRNQQERVAVSLNVVGVITDQKIAPLLLVNFVENAFKHGVKSNIESAALNIDINVKDKTFEAIVQNTIHTNTMLKESVKTEGGIGIENVKRRLQLLYPNRHQIKISSSSTLFTVSLKIELY